MFKLVLEDTSPIKDAVPIIAEIIDEGIFKIRPDGLSLLSPDRTMVSVVDFKIPASSFAEFNVEGENELGLNMASLVNVIKRLKSSDKLILESGKENRLVLTMIGKGKRKFELSLLDIKTEKPPIDQLKFHGKVTLHSGILEEGVADADVISDSVVFEASGDVFRLSSKGDTSSTELEMRKGDEGIVSMEATGNLRARYPLEYLKKMIKAAKLSGNAVIEFGTDYPLRLRFASDKVSMSFILAPRVED